MAVPSMPSEAGKVAGRKKAEATGAETSSPLEGSKQWGSRSYLGAEGAEDIMATATGLAGPTDEPGHSEGPEAERASGLAKEKAVEASTGLELASDETDWGDPVSTPPRKLLGPTKGDTPGGEAAEISPRPLRRGEHGDEGAKTPPHSPRSGSEGSQSRSLSYPHSQSG